MVIEIQNNRIVISDDQIERFLTIMPEDNAYKCQNDFIHVGMNSSLVSLSFK